MNLILACQVIRWEGFIACLSNQDGQKQSWNDDDLNSKRKKTEYAFQIFTPITNLPFVRTHDNLNNANWCTVFDILSIWSATTLNNMAKTKLTKSVTIAITIIVSYRHQTIIRSPITECNTLHSSHSTQ